MSVPAMVHLWVEPLALQTDDVKASAFEVSLELLAWVHSKVQQCSCILHSCSQNRPSPWHKLSLWSKLPLRAEERANMNHLQYLNKRGPAYI